MPLPLWYLVAPKPAEQALSPEASGLAFVEKEVNGISVALPVTVCDIFLVPEINDVTIVADGVHCIFDN